VDRKYPCRTVLIGYGASAVARKLHWWQCINVLPTPVTNRHVNASIRCKEMAAVYNLGGENVV
jgi:hypothetical protein